MILRDPVHGLVDFEGPDEKTIEALLATREVQRLRRVRQLGLTSLVFPGAEHSRFSHALGAAHVMVRLQKRIRDVQSSLPPELRLDDEARRDALAAALLHDLGHGPFSHLYEQVMPGARHHESWTVDALRSEETEIHAALERLSSGMAERVSSLLEGTHPIGYLCRTISGRWDVDRADYLLRDSHMTGVRYGLYDLDWLLRAFNFAQLPSGDWVLAIEGRKGLPPIEGFFLARHYMYQQVYHHKATRAAEQLIRGIFRRLAELVRDGRPPERCPRAFVAAVRGDTVGLMDYLELDDAAMLSHIGEWAKGGDTLLGRLCSDLLHRRLPKTLPLPADDEAIWSKVHACAVEIVEDAGERPDLMVHLDVPTDVPYADDENDVDGLHVHIRHRGLRRLGDASFLLQQLRGKQIRRPRLIFPSHLRVPIRKAAGELIEAGGVE